jgi:hypothetical protein
MVALALPLASNTLFSQQSFFRVEDLRPGMKGVGKTCYQGSKPEEFGVEILGVMKHINPGADAVLARFSGEMIDKTGVFEGMSGSPVYIDGKLLGAVAFSYPFSKEAIGGITPITQMVNTFEQDVDFKVVNPGIGLKKSMLWDFQKVIDGAGRGLPLLSRDNRWQPVAVSTEGHTLQPIATPLSLAGFSPATLERFSPQFRALGLSMLQGSGSMQSGGSPSTSSLPDNSPLEPGSNLVIHLVRGDLEVSAGGTVTHIDGDRLYAFGHPLFNLGFSQLPMHKGRALIVFPSMQTSFKILEATEPVGAMRQDRGMGIYGVLGETAEMLPIHIKMKTSRRAEKDLNFEIALDRFLSPFMVNLTIFNSILASERGLGYSTIKVKGQININGENPVKIDDRYSSDSNSPVFAALSVAMPLNFLLAFGYQNLDLESIDLEITTIEDDRSAILESIRLDRSELKAGDSVNLETMLRKSNGEVVKDTYPVKIPESITPGDLSLLVADGNSIMTRDTMEQGEQIVPRNLTHLIRLLNNLRRNDRLYVRLFRRGPGAVVKGEGLPGLPPSILSILNSERNTGNMRAIDKTNLMEYQLPQTDYVVNGAKLFNLIIKP